METTTETPARPAETAEQFVQKMKRATRRKFGAEEKIRIILEGLKREVSTSELCRRERIHPHIYYSWLKDFMEGGKARLRKDGVRDATVEDVAGLRRENDRLKTIVADQVLEVTLLKKSLAGTDDGIGR
jgi:transposase